MLESIKLDAGDATRLAVYRWRTDRQPRAIVLIVHSMAEHARRYDAFARQPAAAIEPTRVGETGTSRFIAGLDA